MIWRVADQVGPPTVRLTVRILEQAIRDWKKPSKPAEKNAEELGYLSVQNELVAFFKSDCCRDILQLLDCSHLDILDCFAKRITVWMRLGEVLGLLGERDQITHFNN